MIRSAIRIPLLFCLLYLGLNELNAQYVPGNAYFGTNNYIEYYAGDLPIILSAPHGGYLEPVSIPDRNCSGCVYSRDIRTEEIAYLVREAIQSVFGKDPHLIINKLARLKLDANREIIEAAQGNAEAETAWTEYHEFIQASKNECVAKYGSAIYIDLHAHGHAIPRIELGYLITKTELQNTNVDLDALNLQNSSAIKHLTNIINPTTSFSEILRGNSCMGAFLEEHGYPCVPSATDPAPAPTDDYFSGGYNTVRHGSRDSSVINAIQFELNYTNIRNSDANRKAFARSLACVIKSYLDQWYLDLDTWDPGNLVTSTADHGPGTLRSALLGATGGDKITFAPALIGDTIRLEKELLICDDITITGPGADLLAISGGDSVRLFRTLSKDSLNLEHLSLVRGNTPINEDGGAVMATGSVRLAHCIIADNYGQDDGGAIGLDTAEETIRIDSCVVKNNSCGDDGGAIRCTLGKVVINASTFKDNYSPSNGGGFYADGTIDIINSTFSNNTAANVGGAFRSFGTGLVSCTNSTFSNNTANYRGGGISTIGPVIFDHCTITNNYSPSIGGGIRIYTGGSCTFKNTIIAKNVGGSQDDISMYQGTVTSQGYNFVADTTGSSWVLNTGDQLSNTSSVIDPKISSLADNGGLTETIALLSDSPCIDQADPASISLLDQRGEERVFCLGPDIGAFELHVDTLVWTGAINSEWTLAGNWDLNIVPTKCNVVEVPGIIIAPIQPIISFPNAECRHLFLRSFSFLKLLETGDLTVDEP